QHGRADPDVLLRDADAAMHRVKDGGGNGHQFFDARMRRRAMRRLRVVAALRDAIPGELELHYQPIVVPADGKRIAAEALARWNGTQFPGIGPAEFIPAAEESGLI